MGVGTKNLLVGRKEYPNWSGVGSDRVRALWALALPEGYLVLKALLEGLRHTGFVSLVLWEPKEIFQQDSIL